MKGQMSSIIPIIIVLIAAALLLVMYFQRVGPFSLRISKGECISYVMENCEKYIGEILRNIEDEKFKGCIENFFISRLSIDKNAASIDCDKETNQAACDCRKNDVSITKCKPWAKIDSQFCTTLE